MSCPADPTASATFTNARSSRENPARANSVMGVRGRYSSTISSDRSARDGSLSRDAGVMTHRPPSSRLRAGGREGDVSVSGEHSRGARTKHEARWQAQMLVHGI